LLKAYFLAHYTSLKRGATKLTKLRPALRDPLLNMLSLSSKSIGNTNSSFTETPEEEFKRYCVVYMFFIVDSYSRRFTNNLLVFNFYNIDVLEIWQRIKRDYPCIEAMARDILTCAAASISVKWLFSIAR